MSRQPQSPAIPRLSAEKGGFEWLLAETLVKGTQAGGWWVNVHEPLTGMS